MRAASNRANTVCEVYVQLCSEVIPASTEFLCQYLFENFFVELSLNSLKSLRCSIPNVVRKPTSSIIASLHQQLPQQHRER